MTRDEWIEVGQVIERDLVRACLDVQAANARHKTAMYAQIDWARMEPREDDG